MTLTDEERRVLLMLHDRMERAAGTVTPRNQGVSSDRATYVVTRSDLSDFVRRCFKVALEDLP